MSEGKVLAEIEISQSGRFYYWRTDTFPIPRREIETSSANMHMIPADAGVKSQLAQVREGDLVHIEGFLVNASRPDGWHWNTSMTQRHRRWCLRTDLRRARQRGRAVTLALARNKRNTEGTFA